MRRWLALWLGIAALGLLSSPTFADTLGIRGRNYGLLEEGLRQAQSWLYSQETGARFELVQRGSADAYAASGWSKLPSTLTINSTEMTELFSCDMTDAASGSLTCDTGGNFTETGAGSLTHDAISPLYDGTEGVTGDGTNTYDADDTDTGDVGTNDIAVAYYFRAPAVSTGGHDSIAEKYATNDGWDITFDSADGVGRLFYLDTGAGATELANSTAMTLGSHYFVMVFVNRDDATDGAVGYVNGAQDGTADPTGHTGDASNAETLKLLGDLQGPFTGTLYGIRMWTCSACMPATTTEQQGIAEDWNAIIHGADPQITNATTDTPDANTEGGLHCDKYNAAGTVRVAYGMGANSNCLARRQNSAGDTIIGYLSEPASQNEHLQSQEFDTSWTATRATVDDQTSGTTAPDGTSTADALVEDGTAALNHALSQTLGTATAATDFVFSVFAKSANRSWAFINADDIGAGGDNGGTYFNLDTCAVGSSGTPAPAVTGAEDWGNGWCRIWIADTYDGTPDPDKRIMAADSDGGILFDGLTQDSIYIWGAQTEEGFLHPTSYVQTTTTAVARAASVLRYKGDDGLIDNNGEGSLTFRVTCPNYDNTSALSLMTLSDGGAATDYITIEIGTDDNIDIVSAAAAGSAGASTVSDDITDGATHYIEASWRSNNMLICVDGTCGTTDTDVGIPNDIDQVHIGANEAGAQQPSCIISDVKIYPRAMQR